MTELSDKTRICTSLFILILLIFFLLPVTSTAAEEEGQQETVIFCIGHPGYSVGGKEIKTDVAPYIRDGRTMVPVAFVAGALGADEIRWVPSERKVVVQKGDKEVSLEIGSKDLYVNNDKIMMDVAAEIKSIGNGGGRAMLPISFVAKAFEIGYDWDNKTRSVFIYKYNKVFDQAGVFGPESDNLIIRGNATVKSDKVTLQNMTIRGNLIVDKEVGAGTVFFKNLNVMGDTLIRGGGENSIHIVGGSYHTIIVQDTGDGVVRVVAADINGLEVVIAEGMSGEGVILEGNFHEVRVEGNDVNVQTQGNTYVDNFTVAPGISGSVISLGNGTTVGKMVLESVTSLTGNGKVQDIVGGDTMLQPEKTPSSSGGSSDDPSLPASKLHLAGNGTVKAGEFVAFTVEAQDAYGNPVAVNGGFTDIITVTDDKGILTPATVSIQENASQADFTWSCTQAGLYTLTAATDGLTSSECEIKVEPAEVSEVLLDGDYTDSLMAGEQLEFYASAYDQYGNVITFDAVDFSWTGAENGTLSEHTAGSYAVSAEYNGVQSDVETVAVIAGQEDAVSLTGLPTDWTAGESIDILNTSGCSIELQDGYGNTVADGQYPVTISSDREGRLFGQGPVQFTDGLSGPIGNTVAIPIQLTAAGEHIITIQAGEAQDTVTVQVSPGPAHQFVFLEENVSITAGEEAALTLEVRDEYGNPTGDHSGLTDVISAPGGIISPETVNIDTEESQTGFTFVSDGAGIYQITADSEPMVSAIYSITVNPGAPAALTVGAIADKGAGEEFDLKMSSLRDSLGNTLLDGTYHLEIVSNREVNVFDGNVVFEDGARDQTIKLNVLGNHLLSVRINGVTVVHDVPVTIIKYGVTGVSINQGEILTIKMEETATLSAIITPANATYPEIIWSSSDPLIAKVSIVDGIVTVTGMSKGNSVITAASADSGIADTIAVEVDYLDISGKGTQAEPFVVYTFAGLEKIGTGKYISNKTSLEPVYYQLGADIDAGPTKDPGYNGGKGWKPITALRMQLDGKGHKISNLMINRPGEDNVGGLLRPAVYRTWLWWMSALQARIMWAALQED